MSQDHDFPIWNHSGITGPLQYQITIQPKSAVPGSPWMVQLKVEAPPGWILKKGGLTKIAPASPSAGEGSSPPSQVGPWTIQGEYQGELPPFGPGPQVETIWDTPGGQVSLLLDSGLALASIQETPEGSPISRPFPWAASVVLGLVVLLMGVLIGMRRSSKFQVGRWVRKTRATQPREGASWSEWESWLNGAAHSARIRLPDVALVREWVSLLDEARFGPPFNDGWKRLQKVMSK